MKKKKRTLKESYIAERAKDKETNEQQNHILKNNFDAELQVREKAFDDYSKQAQGEVKQTIENRTRKLNEKHGTELRLYVKIATTCRPFRKRFQIQKRPTESNCKIPKGWRSGNGRFADNFWKYCSEWTNERQNLLTTLNEVQKSERQQNEKKFELNLIRKLDLEDAHSKNWRIRQKIVLPEKRIQKPFEKFKIWATMKEIATQTPEWYREKIWG